MMHDQIDRMVRQANPVPDLMTLEPVDASVLVLDRQRRTEVQTNDRIEVDQGRGKPVRGFLVGIAAIAAVVVGVAILSQSKNPGPVGSPAEVAAAFVEAYAAFDMDRAFTYLAPDADISWPEDVDGYRLYNGLLEASGFKFLLDSCEETSSSSSLTGVACNFDYHAIRSDEIGLGPFTDSRFNLVVRDGVITRVRIDLNVEQYGPQMWEPFADWVAANYPDDVTIMYTDQSQTLERVTDESIALWEERSREYVEFVQNSG